jgi:DNA processing protein
LKRQEQQQEQEDPEYQLLLEKLGFDPITIDKLIQRSGLTSEEVSSMLLLLELKGQVESLAGGLYVRTKT